MERSGEHRMGADMVSEKIRRGGSAYVREIRMDIFMMRNFLSRMFMPSGIG